MVWWDCLFGILLWKMFLSVMLKVIIVGVCFIMFFFCIIIGEVSYYCNISWSMFIKCFIVMF